MVKQYLDKLNEQLQTVEGCHHSKGSGCWGRRFRNKRYAWTMKEKTSTGVRDFMTGCKECWDQMNDKIKRQPDFQWWATKKAGKGKGIWKSFAGRRLVKYEMGRITDSNWS